MIRNRTGANARGTPRLPPSAAVGVITSDDVINTSTVPGATVTDALDSLAGAGVLQSWASTLSVGSVSGGVSPQVSDTDNLEFLAATPVATDGRVRGAQGFSIMGRDAGNAANATLLDWGTVADTLVVGGSSFPTVVNSADAQGLALATGAVARLTLSAAMALLSVSPLQFASGVATPTIDQATTGGAAGQPLAITAQAAATTGGNVVLSGGSGGTTQGSVDVANDSPLRFTGASPTAQTGLIRSPQNFSIIFRNAANTADFPLATVGIGVANRIAIGSVDSRLRLTGEDSASGVQIFAGASTTTFRSILIEFTAPILQWDSAVVAPSLIHETTGVATGQPLTVQAQNAATTGGNLVLTGGSGGTTQGSVDIANDSPLRFTGASPTATTGSMRVPNGWMLNYRHQADTTDLAGLQLGTGAVNTVTLGNSTGTLQLVGPSSSSSTQIIAGATTRVTVGTTIVELNVATLRYDQGVSAPVFQQESRSVGAGETLSIHSQDTTDATANGGALAIRSGSGGATSGQSGPLTIDTPNSAGQSGDLTIQVGDVSTDNVTAGLLSILGGDGGGNEFGGGGNIVVQPGAGGSVPTAGQILLNHAGGTTAIRVAHAGAVHTGGQAIIVTSSGLAFFNGSPAVQPSVTGIRDSNTALASLLTELDSMGLITDNTTAT